MTKNATVLISLADADTVSAIRNLWNNNEIDLSVISVHIFNSMAIHRPYVMVSIGWVSTLKGDLQNRLRAHTRPLRVPVRPHVYAHPI